MEDISLTRAGRRICVPSQVACHGCSIDSFAIVEIKFCPKVSQRLVVCNVQCGVADVWFDKPHSYCEGSDE